MACARSASIFCCPRKREDFLRDLFPELLPDDFFAVEEVAETGWVAVECRFCEEVEPLFFVVTGFVLVEDSWPTADTTSVQLRASAQTAPSCIFRIVLSPRSIEQPSNGKEKAQPEEPAL